MEPTPLLALATSAPIIERTRVISPPAWPRRYEAALAAAFAVLAYVVVVGLATVPPLPRSNSNLFLLEGVRVLGGEHIYRDFFELTYPGTTLYYAAAIRLFGPSAWVPAATMIVLAMACAWLTTSIARGIVSEPTAVLAGVMTLVVPVYVDSDATHHWFSTVAALLAVRLAMNRTARSDWGAGLCCALTTFFTQSKGPMVAIAICAWWAWQPSRERDASARIHIARVAGGVVLGCAVLLGWFVYDAGLRTFWSSTVTFLFKNYSAIAANNLAGLVPRLPSRRLALLPDTIADGFTHLLVPVVYIVAMLRYAKVREWRDPTAVMLIIVAGAAMFVPVALSPTTERLATISMPAMVALLWMLEEPVHRKWLRAVWAAALMMVFAAPVAATLQHVGAIDLPIGRVTVNSEPLLQTLQWLRTRTRPGQPAFGNPGFEYMLGLKPVGKIPWVSASDYTTPEQVTEVMASLQRSAHAMLFLHAGAYLPQQGANDHAGPFRDYVRANYRLVQILPTDFEVWVRKGSSLPQ